MIAAVLTTCAAFVPLAFIEGRIGTILGVLPVVVICALSVLAGRGLPHPARAPRATCRASRRRPSDGPTAGFNEAKHHLFERLLPGLLERQLRWLLHWRYAVAALCLHAPPLRRRAPGRRRRPVRAPAGHRRGDRRRRASRWPPARPRRRRCAMLGIAERTAGAHPEVATVFTVIGSSFGDRGRRSRPTPPPWVSWSSSSSRPTSGRRRGWRPASASSPTCGARPPDCPG